MFELIDNLGAILAAWRRGVTVRKTLPHAPERLRWQMFRYYDNCGEQWIVQGFGPTPRLALLDFAATWARRYNEDGGHDLNWLREAHRPDFLHESEQGK